MEIWAYTRKVIPLFFVQQRINPELLALVPLLRSRDAKIVGIFGNDKGQLTTKVDAYLDSSVPEGPIRSESFRQCFAVSASLGDALASALMKRRNFRKWIMPKRIPPDNWGET